MRVRVVTPSYPTRGEPYRGAPVWATLQHLSQYVNLEAFCTVPDYHFQHRPRTYVYSAPQTGLAAPNIVSHTIRYFAVPWFTRPINGRSIYRSLRASLGSERPDLLLTYWVYPEGYAAVLLGRDLGIPVVVGSRGSDLKLTPTTGVMGRKVRYTLEHASAVLCVSSDLGTVARRLGAPPERVQVVRNGVDGSVFRNRDPIIARQQSGIPQRTRLVLYVGRWDSLKGLAQLLEAIALLNREQPGQWILALAGAGFLGDSLKRQAETLEIAERILFLGTLPAQEIAQWMNASDLLCLPSESEGCPNVILEALACGCPVVATAVGGIPGLVGEDCAVLIPTNDPRS